MPKKYVADPADATVVDEADVPKKRGRPAKTEKIVKKSKKVVKPEKAHKKGKKVVKEKESRGRRGAEKLPSGIENPAAAAVRSLRGKMTLADFAVKTGFNSAPAVSRLENPAYSGTSMTTLLRLAHKMKCKLIVKFSDK